MPLRIETTTPPSLSCKQAEALAGQLVEDMTRRWRMGEFVAVEEYLARHPDLKDHPEAASELIYEEICLRQEYGQATSTEEVLARFPHWRRQLEVLLDCQRVLGPRQAPLFPTVGESFGDFLLLQELGRGAYGRVFLASQLSLGDRPVVLKLTPFGADEHLSLARLQHTHIVPLHCIQDDPSRGLRALCMPFFGGLTLAQILEKLRSIPITQRAGRHIADLLERAQPSLEEAIQAPARQALVSVSYVEAVCWIGICLAHGLQYAHDHGLVHLDVKPSNILLAADGQPMLLDFHLARGPIQVAEPGLAWLGGTLGYMSPEQEASVQKAQVGRPITNPIDGRSDQYSLGLVLTEMLSGQLTSPGQPLSVAEHNPLVSVGLADILARCLCEQPEKRYSQLSELAADLRCHLEHRPLQGVRNRSWGERWCKWRHRRPQGATLLIMMITVLAATLALVVGMTFHFQQRLEEARAALREGQDRLMQNQPDAALVSLQRGLLAAQSVPFQGDLIADLSDTLTRAESAQNKSERFALLGNLHQVAEQARYLYGQKREVLRDPRLLVSCRALWHRRDAIVTYLQSASTTQNSQAREDLLDLAILWADLQDSIEPGQNHDACTILFEAEKLFGCNAVTLAERRRHCDAVEEIHFEPVNAWERYAVGRVYLRQGLLNEAAQELKKSLMLQPQGFWPNFYEGQCALRQNRYADAVQALSVCVGAAPEFAGSFYHRSLAYKALGQDANAARDREIAIQLDPTLAKLP